MSENTPEYKTSHQQAERSIFLECNRKEIGEALARIGKVAIRKKDYMLELDIRKNKVEIIGIGVSFQIVCKADSYAKVTVPYQMLYNIIKGSNEVTLSLRIKKEEITSGNFCIWSPFVTIKHPENQRRIDIPINYLPNEFLSLRLRYTSEELKDKNLLQQLEKAEMDLREAIGKAVEFLRPYEIRREDLEKLAADQIRKYISI